MLTAQRAHELFRYDAMSGKLFWRSVTNPRIKIGSEVGYTTRLNGHKTKYVLCQVDNRRYLVHRIVWLMIHWSWPKFEIDHRDRNGLNNRIVNLRDVSRSVNQLNSGRCNGGIHRHGVSSKWVARITINGKREYLGIFTSKKDAMKARKSAEVRLGLS